MKTYLITGGLGFIGSNYIRKLISEDEQCKIINLDKMTYAGNPDNLNDLKNFNLSHFFVYPTIKINTR